MISSIWHGFYVAYYISFAMWFAQLHLQGLIFKYCKNGRSNLVKMYNKSGIAGWILLTILVQLLFSHCGAYFLIMEGYYNWKMMLKLKFVPFIILIGLIAVFSTIRPPRDPKPKTQDQSR